ncbi:flavin reductase family protein [Psychromicrobium lacuslunae]|uniref:Oxidoreductase n=1 Tax=Psychromicrobium lacuslunae TaxID=1618207 RepID=A0A0D4BV98_9MICC|nr:flavin reductase family protein [Psychromicrobium lacuslunae]AJT40362.1 oxidoreductase [Psychromicrobium lacuslunae]
MTLNRDLNPATLREAFACFPSGVVALCARVNDEAQGLIASSFTVGVSLEPALVSFAVQNTSKTWPVLRGSERIGISVLGTEHHEACRQIAGKAPNRFKHLKLTSSPEGALFLDGSALWMEASVYAEIPAGDHQVVLLEVHAVATHDKKHAPLLFHESRFHDMPQRSSSEPAVR